ncbi:MAG: hypothetical protein LQ339_007677, partial [Xanthoria mediterranea]
MPPKRISGGPMVVVQGPAYSDGDASHRPETGNLTRANEDGYLQTLAEKWMREEVGAAQPGRRYTLDRLPAGYQAWERPRPNNPKHVDRWLYGHPDQKRFDSPNRFYPHFKYLMQHGNGEACQCDLCGSKGRTRGPSKSTARPQAATKRPTQPAPLNRGPVDEEGTPDVYCSLFTLLKNEGTLSRTIEERASLDWRAEKPLVQKFASVIPKQPAFIPRSGEIVLYIRSLPPGIQLQQDPKTHHFSLHDTIRNRPAGSPKWLAGVVTQTPSTPLDSASLYPPPPGDGTHPTDSPSLNQSGFRIEPLPSPNSSDKNLSKQHTYTPLHLIRPFAFWQHLLAGTLEPEWHISIHNALTASATVSLINRSRFTGHWPNAAIYSDGLFVGAESYWIGDTVRLLLPPPNPPNAPNPTTLLVLQIQKIITQFHTLSPEPSLPALVTGNRCQRITLTIQGPVFTSSRPQTSLSSHHRRRAHPTRQSPPMRTYQGIEWWHLDAPEEIHSVSFANIHSRLYESEAVASYLPTKANIHHETETEIEMESILQARTIAAATDERIVDTDANQDREGETAKGKWFWADCRADGLDLQSVNGVEVGG